MMSSNLPNEPASTLLRERTFMGGDYIAGIVYGFEGFLLVQCTRHLWQERWSRRSVLLFIYLAALFMAESIYGAVQSRTLQAMYVDNRNYPGGPWQYLLHHETMGINVASNVTLTIMTFLSDAFLCWRCWVIWTAISGRRVAAMVTFFPGLIVVVSFVLGTLHMIQFSHPRLIHSASIQTTFLATAFGVNIILSLLIASRLLLYRHHVRRRYAEEDPSESAETLLSNGTLVVESGGLYAIASALFLITYAVNSSTRLLLICLVNSFQQLTIYCIVYRMSERKAWETSSSALDARRLKQAFPQFAMQLNALEPHDFVPKVTTPRGNAKS